MQQTLLIVLAAILISIRLPSFFARQNMPKNERVLLLCIVYILLVLALLAVDGFSYLLSLFSVQ